MTTENFKIRHAIHHDRYLLARELRDLSPQGSDAEARYQKEMMAHSLEAQRIDEQYYDQIWRDEHTRFLRLAAQAVRGQLIENHKR